MAIAHQPQEAGFETEFQADASVRINGLMMIFYCLYNDSDTS
jgi:hypothetical protein